MSYENVLTEMRKNPENAFAQMAFITEVEVENYEEGGRRKMEIERLDKKRQIYQCRITNQAGDIYYFPYKNTRGNTADGSAIYGIGHVVIPKGAPDGTIVVTGGMNGCALQVDILDAGHLLFMHDQNSDALKDRNSREYFLQEQNLGGTLGEADLINPARVLCRVEAEHYIGPKSLHYDMALRYAEKEYPGASPYMAYFPFFIKMQGKWKLYMSLAGHASDEKGKLCGYLKGEGVYLSGMHCVASFEER